MLGTYFFFNLQEICVWMEDENLIDHAEHK